MPSYYVKQPNGRIARFTTIADGFTHMDMTREQAIDIARRQYGYSADDAAAAVDRALADESAFYDEGKPRRKDGLKRWHGCIEIIRLRSAVEYVEAVGRGTAAPTG